MKPTRRSYALALACGVLLALSFPTWSLFPLAWIVLAPLFSLACSLTPAAAFSIFFITGWAFYSILLQWLATNIYWGGGWALWGYQLLCIYMAASWGLLGLLWTWCRRRSPRFIGAIAAAFFWAAMEYAQATLFTGFGWGAIGYSQGPNLPILQWAAVGSVTLVSTLIVCFNVLVGLACAEPRYRLRRVMAAVLLVSAAHGFGVLNMAEADYTSKPMRAGVVQSNFPLEMKHDPEYAVEMIRNTAQKSQWLWQFDRPIDLFVWPESLVMDPFEESPESLELISTLCLETGTPLFSGITRRDETTREIRNSSAFINAEGSLETHYDKIHLAPWGEYVPFREHLPFIGRIVPSMGDIEPGTIVNVIDVGERRLGPLICFEMLFSPMAETLRRRGADMLAVITNLGWFGASNAIPQELDIARLRAIETRLPLIHSANTGISGVFDPWGRFEPVNTIFDSAGRQITFKDIQPTDMLMRRCAAVLPVAAPGTRLIPMGPPLFPWVAVSAAVFLLFAALLVKDDDNEVLESESEKGGGEAFQRAADW